MTDTFTLAGRVLDKSKRPLKREKLVLTSNDVSTADPATGEVYTVAPQVMTDDSGYLCRVVNGQPDDEPGVVLVVGPQYTLRSTTASRFESATFNSPTAGTTLNIAEIVPDPPETPATFADLMLGLNEAIEAGDTEVAADAAAALASGLATKVNTSTYTAGLATKADASALTTETTRALAAEATKADTTALTSHTGNTSNPHAVTKAQVGLGNADNTSDVNKPVSTAQAAAIAAAPFVPALNVNNLATPVILGHRGGGALAAPDGTIESMRAHVGYGYPAIDCGDFRATLDGGSVCMHDSTLDRTTSMTGNVSDVSLAALMNGTVDASSWFGGGWLDTKIPTWGQIVGEFGGKVVIFPEAKDDVSAQNIARTVAALKLGKSCVVGAFDIPKVLPAIAAGAEGCVASPDATADPAALKAQGINFVSVDHALASLANIDNLIAGGMKVLVYPLVRQNEFDRYTGRNIWGFLLDDPLYTSRNYTAYRKLVAPWVKSGTFYSGHIPVTNSPDANRGTFVGTPGAYRWKQTLDGFVLQGWGSPIANAAGTYSITIPITYDTLPSDMSRWKGIFVCAPQDLAYNNQGAATENGYLILMRASGAMAIFKITNGVGTTGPTATTAAVTAGGTATVRVDVTPTTVTATRTDVAGSVSMTDSTFRGGYFYLGQTGIAQGLTTSVGAVTIA